jgi:hypothetical protein
MRTITRSPKTARTLIGSLLVLASTSGVLALGATRAGASTVPLSDSGAANCASDGGTLGSNNVCKLGAGHLHQQYEALIASSGGSGPTPFLFKVVAGSIPAGMQVPPDYAIGEHGTIIAGTPTKRGTFAFTIQVTDGTGATANGQFTLTINR